MLGHGCINSHVVIAFITDSVGAPQWVLDLGQYGLYRSMVDMREPSQYDKTDTLPESWILRESWLLCASGFQFKG